MNIFDRINLWIESAEGSMITFATIIIPWAAPLLPAYLTGYHLIFDLLIPRWVAIPMAATVELLGLAAISTMFDAMRHNKTYGAKMRKVSLGFPVGAYLYYMAVILTTNVIMALPLASEARPYVKVAVLALLTTISAPGFIIAVARHEQRKIAREYTEAKLSKHDAKKPQASAYFCLECEQSFGTKQAYGAHTRWKHRNGHEKEKVEL